MNEDRPPTGMLRLPLALSGVAYAVLENLPKNGLHSPEAHVELVHHQLLLHPDAADNATKGSSDVRRKILHILPEASLNVEDCTSRASSEVAENGAVERRILEEAAIRMCREEDGGVLE